MLPFDDPRKLTQFAEIHPDLVYRYMLRRLTKAVKRDMPLVQLFRYGTSNRIALIKQSSYITQLRAILAFFVSIEDYETAGTCHEIITGYQRATG